jgi:hypothetical protein
VLGHFTLLPLFLTGTVFMGAGKDSAMEQAYVQVGIATT